MANPLKSYLLVTLQFAAIFSILLTGPLFARQPLLLLIEVSGGLIGVWALLVMHRTTLHVLPDVRAEGRLVHRGPYRYIRHPMYLAVLLTTLALVLAAFSMVRLGIWVILAVDILVKINYEEQLLRSHYPDYIAYQQQSWRLLPWLY